MRYYFKSVGLLVMLSCLFFTSQAQNTAFTSEAKTISYNGNNYAVYIVNPKMLSIDLFVPAAGSTHSFTAIKNNYLATKKQLVFAMNAGMYDTDKQPIGLCIINGEQLKPLNPNSGPQYKGNFNGLPPNGVFASDGERNAYVVQTGNYSQLAKSHTITTATQSGPMVVFNDTINVAFKEGSSNLNIRNGVGINKNGYVVFVISETKVNFYDFARVFRDVLGCSNALYLDGFVSKMYLPELNWKELGNTSHLGPIIAIGILQP